MSRLNNSVLLPLLMVTTRAFGLTVADSTIMRTEADNFLAALPSGLQEKQCTAVKAAIAGDFSLLNDVRNSRNTAPDISDGVNVNDFTIKTSNGKEIDMRLFYPRQEPATHELPLLIYFHGGGWTFGSLNSCSRFCDALVSTGTTAVLAVDYSLAPDHPYPEGLTDCISAIDYAFNHSRELGVSPTSISVGGDSSGGNLALATALFNNDNACWAIKSIVLFYPVTRAENDGSTSWQLYGDGFGLDSQLMHAFNEAYRSETSESTHIEYISPALASASQLQKLPEILMISAERDILSDQGKEFADRISAVGGKIERIELPGTVHLFITVAGQPCAFDKSIDMTASFLQR